MWSGKSQQCLNYTERLINGGFNFEVQPLRNPDASGFRIERVPGNCQQIQVCAIVVGFTGLHFKVESTNLF